MRPAYRITVAGSNITEAVLDRFISLTLTDEAGVKSDRLELVLDDRDQALKIPPTKAEITVSIGYTSRLVNKGTYTVEEIEIEGPERRMTIRANAAGATKGAGAARERSWHDTTLGGIARTISKRHGWTTTISPELDSIQFLHIDQHENDMQFLVRLAINNGAVAKVTHGKLAIAPHAQGKTVSGKSLPVVTLNATDTTDWVMTLAERGAYTGVKAIYRDLKTAEHGEAIAGEDNDNTHNMPHTFTSKAEAERAVKAKKKSLEHAKRQFEVKNAPGVPEIESEITIDAKGFRKDVDGKWSVVGVTHTISEAGYVMAIRCELPDDSAPLVVETPTKVETYDERKKRLQAEIDKLEKDGRALLAEITQHNQTAQQYDQQRDAALARGDNAAAEDLKQKILAEINGNKPRQAQLDQIIAEQKAKKQELANLG